MGIDGKLRIQSVRMVALAGSCMFFFLNIHIADKTKNSQSENLKRFGIINFINEFGNMLPQTINENSLFSNQVMARYLPGFS